MNSLCFFLKDMLECCKEFEDAIYIGHDAYIPLSTGNRLKISLCNNHTMDNYDSITMKVINDESGIIDNCSIEFSEYFNKNSSNIIPHIWKDGLNFEWYGNPTIADISTLVDAIKDYTYISNGFTNCQDIAMNL